MRKAYKHSILQRRKNWLVQEFYGQFAQFCRDFYNYEPHSNTEPSRVGQTFGCLICRRRYKNRAGEAAHMFRVHQHVAKRRRLVDTANCPACLKEYNAMEKLTAHLYYARSCRLTLLRRNYACHHVPGAGSQDDRTRRHAHDWLLPPLQAEGLHLPQQRIREENEVDTDFHLFLMETFIDADDAGEALRRIVDQADASPMTWTSWTSTLHFFMETLAEEDIQRWNTQLCNIKA